MPNESSVFSGHSKILSVVDPNTDISLSCRVYSELWTALTLYKDSRPGSTLASLEDAPLSADPLSLPSSI